MKQKKRKKKKRQREIPLSVTQFHTQNMVTHYQWEALTNEPIEFVMGLSGPKRIGRVSAKVSSSPTYLSDKLLGRALEARLESQEVSGICDLAESFGSLWFSVVEILFYKVSIAGYPFHNESFLH